MIHFVLHDFEQLLLTSGNFMCSCMRQF